MRGAMILSIAAMGAAQAQDGIDAPETYQVEWLGISRTDVSRFEVEFAFEGVDDQGDAVEIELDSRVVLQPNPPAYHVQTTATGDLVLFRLVPFDSDQTVLENEIVYERRFLYTYVRFPDSDRYSCGQSVSGGSPAVRRLEQQVPLPSAVFESLPAVERAWPDAEFDGQPVARYIMENLRTPEVRAGRLEFHVLPDEGQVVYFAFEGQGHFWANDYQLNGQLRYIYRLLPRPSSYVFQTAPECDPPNVQGVVLFEPSSEWIVREDRGFYLTNQSVRRLLEFHNQTLTIAGFELVNPPMEGFGSTSVTYRSPEGSFVDIVLYEGFDGTQVEIQFQP